MTNHRKTVLERKIKGEKKMKREVNREFPKFVLWENVDYHEQITKYFAKVKGLPGTSLNPKVNIIIEHMIAKYIVEMFGLDCSSFKPEPSLAHGC
jgi:hypothetical protein